MSFGNGYEPNEYNQFVPEGDYTVRLGLPKDVVVNGYSIREIPIEIKGWAGYGPEKWSIFDAPDRSDPEYADHLAKWNKQRTCDADAFGVERGDFRPQSWVGKIGKVRIAKDKKGYMRVIYSIVERDAQQQTHQQTPQRQAQPARQPAPATDDFTDDIPF